MLKRMMLMALSVGMLIAFAAPAAQGNVFLAKGGDKLSPGDLVTATSTNLLVKQTDGASLICTKYTLHFEVVSNGGLEHVELEQTQTATTSHCTANGVLPATVQNGGVTQNITFDTWGTANVASTAVYSTWLNAAHTMLAATPCDYAGTLHIEGLASGNDSIRVNKSALTAAGCKEAHVEGTFTLETSTGGSVSLAYVETP